MTGSQHRRRCVVRFRVVIPIRSIARRYGRRCMIVTTTTATGTTTTVRRAGRVGPERILWCDDGGRRKGRYGGAVVVMGRIGNRITVSCRRRRR